MAATALTAAQSIVRAGLEATYDACNADGNYFANTGNEFIHIVNAAVADQTITIATPATVDGLAVADRSVVVTASEERFIGPFPTATYNDGDGRVQLTYDAVVTLTVALLKLG